MGMLSAGDLPSPFTVGDYGNAPNLAGPSRQGAPHMEPSSSSPRRTFNIVASSGPHSPHVFLQQRATMQAPAGLDLALPDLETQQMVGWGFDGMGDGNRLVMAQQVSTCLIPHSFLGLPQRAD